MSLSHTKQPLEQTFINFLGIRELPTSITTFTSFTSSTLACFWKKWVRIFQLFEPTLNILSRDVELSPSWSNSVMFGILDHPLLLLVGIPTAGLLVHACGNTVADICSHSPGFVLAKDLSATVSPSSGFVSAGRFRGRPTGLLRGWDIDVVNDVEAFAPWERYSSLLIVAK